MKTLNVILLLLFLSNSNLALAQKGTSETNELSAVTSVDKYKLNKNNSIFTIKGTSSLHDWEMVSKTFDGTISITYSDAENFEINEISINIGVTTLDSDNRIMNKKTYDALKSDDHPNIYYKFTSVKSMKSIGNNTFEVMLNGTLKIAGKSKSVDILVTLIMENNKISSIKGAKPLKMSDFDVEPPTALLGTIKTGNDITIEFNLNYL